MEVGVKLKENRFLINSLTRASRLKNDRNLTRIPITKGVLKLILDQTASYFAAKNQLYLMKTYRALFVAAYYGLL